MPVLDESSVLSKLRTGKGIEVSLLYSSEFSNKTGFMTSHLSSTGPEAHSLVTTQGQGCAFLPGPTARNTHCTPRRSPLPAFFVLIVPLLKTLSGFDSKAGGDQASEPSIGAAP